MSKKKVGEKYIVDIVKNIVETRDDVKVDDLFIHKITSNTVQFRPAVDILSTMAEWKNTGESESDERQLTRCIEVLAIINSIIDYHLSAGKLN
jgi:hypothetical protein